ncbi:UDP-2,3-diacylglucosamine hydrolase [bacterium HR33]|nr:UDP-2,3-diacylglucosamine hydrolase [bacterium HR33]
MSETAYLVADAHLGRGREPDRDAFVTFVSTVPQPGDHLVLLGDIFDFWIEYRSVIPRYAFPVLCALRETVARGTRLIVVGGNHDRWGSTFWRRELGGEFYPGKAEVELCGRRAYLSHGDGVSDPHAGARILQTALRRDWAANLFRLLPPDLGFSLVHRFSQAVAKRTRDPSLLDRAAAAQANFARRLLEERPEVDLVVMAHTHRPILEEPASGRWYVNPGAWIDGRNYAVLAGGAPQLRRFA